MSRRAGLAVVIIVVLFAAAQLIRPERAHTAIDPGRAIQAQPGATRELVAVLDRACSDCHSNHSAWPRYTTVAPLSWVVARAESEGRRVLDFSDWASYSPEQRRALLDASCQDVSSSRMPGSPYTLVRPEARLSAHDIETICAAAREAGTGPAAARREP
jgi:hypothetical protein